MRYAQFDSSTTVRYELYVEPVRCKGCRKGEPVARGLCKRCLPPDHKRIRR